MIFQLYSVISSTIVQLVFIVVINIVNAANFRLVIQLFSPLRHFASFCSLVISEFSCQGVKKLNITKRMLPLKKPNV